MAIKVVSIGKTSDEPVKVGINTYLKRLNKYSKVHWIELPDIKKKLFKDPTQLKVLEGQALLKECKPGAFVVGLDEKGTQYTSRAFATKLNTWTTNNTDVVFVIGGAYGFSDEAYGRMDGMLSLSKMTFSHQMVRLFLAEQLYRGYTILRGEPYHND